MCGSKKLAGCLVIWRIRCVIYLISIISCASQKKISHFRTKRKKETLNSWEEQKLIVSLFIYFSLVMRWLFFGLNMSLCSILSVVDVVGVFFLLEFISVLLLGLLTVQFQVSSNVAFHYRLLNLIEWKLKTFVRSRRVCVSFKNKDDYYSAVYIINEPSQLNCTLFKQWKWNL